MTEERINKEIIDKISKIVEPNWKFNMDDIYKKILIENAYNQIILKF